MMDIINNAPRSVDSIRDKRTKRPLQSYEQSLIGKHFRAIEEHAENGLLSSVDLNDFNKTFDYWHKTFPDMANETRSSIISTLSSMIDLLTRGELGRLFSTDTTITPEDSFCAYDGKPLEIRDNSIIVLGLPIKEWGQVGIAAQVIFKYVWQQAIERRTISKDTLPSFLWADEAHLFITEYDQEFLTTARSSRACTVYLSQNLPNYTAALGEHAKSRVESLLGNFQTKIFHQNTDPHTNNYAADLIGKTLQMRKNFNNSFNSGTNSGDSSNGKDLSLSSGHNKGTGISYGASEQLEHQILPITFNQLRKGASANDFCVDAIIHQGGRIWNATEQSYIFTTFKQRG